jgi:hypothetical protein
MSDELYGRLEKYMEGTSLGLAALSEVLTKMDARLTKAEEEQVTVDLAKAEEEERTSLIKDVASAVAELLKATDDLDGDKTRTAKKSGALNADGDDSSTAVTPPSAAPDQQATIQAEDDKDKDEDIEDAEYPMKEREDDEEVPARASEEDVEDGGEREDKDELEDVEDAMVQRMKKQIDDLQKQITEYEGSLSKAVSKETDTRLRKMGFKEERRLVAPTQLTSFGQDEVKIVKASPTGDDITEQLADLSYSELRKLQHKVEKGEVTLN